ncbi:MAG: hypothetical protein JRJ29_03755 [Deltaproteobacteria bacterium]|nr:hypothetical protein [Deltaproteobacteria bacterium]
MTTKNKELWDSITRFLSGRLAKSEVDLWFCSTCLLDLTDDSAVIGVPNKFVASWIKEKYMLHIRESFRAILNSSPSVRFSYGPGKDLGHTQETGETGDFTHPLAQNLHPSMTFESFVKAESNELAFASALRVATGTSQAYNPLYIHCELPLGKTHLLNAIGNHVTRVSRERKPLYLSPSTFTSFLWHGASPGDPWHVLDDYGPPDMFLFDDIHQLEKRKHKQSQFLNVFDKLWKQNCPMVITGSKLPHDLKDLNPELKSRIASGILAEIKTPDLETKMRIITARMTQDGISLPDDLVFYIASSHRDFKSLFSALTKVRAFYSIHGKDKTTISTIKRILEAYQPKPGLREIKITTSAYFGISESDLVSSSKNRALSYPRHMAMYLARKHTNLSCKEIGESFGHKDHSTVLYAIRKIENAKGDDPKVVKDLARIEKIITLGEPRPKQ